MFVGLKEKTLEMDFEETFSTVLRKELLLLLPRMEE
jgi:hypothetical protein